RQDDVGVRLELGIARRAALQELGVAHDDEQAIVEVVSDSADQASHRLELLRLTKPFFQALARFGGSQCFVNVEDVDDRVAKPAALVAQLLGRKLPPTVFAAANVALLHAVSVDLP